jgi:hypothetical protein
MKKINCYLLFTFLTFQGFCQSNIFPSEKPQKIERTKYPLTTRLTFYPFNQSAKIMLVSFDKQVDSSRYKRTNYLRSSDYVYKIPTQNDTICVSKLTQTLLLNANQVDTLSDILYNTCFRWTIIVSRPGMCYLPHNAILFFDTSDKVLDYIEICFDCYQIKYSNKIIEKFEQCDFAISDLKNYFKQLGIYVTMKDFQNKTSR